MKAEKIFYRKDIQSDGSAIIFPKGRIVITDIWKLDMIFRVSIGWFGIFTRTYKGGWMRIRKFEIRSLKDSLEDTKRACRLAMSGKGKKVTDMEVYFESVDAMRAVLTEERVNLLKAIKAKKPKSIYELTKVTGRNLKNVSQDVNRLAELGLIDLKKSGDPRRSAAFQKTRASRRSLPSRNQHLKSRLSGSFQNGNRAWRSGG